MPPSTPVCARCPRVLGVSCCEVKDGEQLATLTWADLDRVGAAATEWEWLTEAQAAAWSAPRPLWRGYFGSALRRLTLRRQGGACVFHGPGGCSLSVEARPTACRLYPFEVRPDGEWSLQVDRFGSPAAAAASKELACLAVEEADSFEALREAFGVSRDELEALAARLLDEVADHRRREQASS